MQELLAAVPQIAGLIEKGGIIGLFVILVGFLLFERWKKMKELHRVYGQRDFCRQVSARYKFALDSAGIKVDISDLERQRQEDVQDET